MSDNIITATVDNFDQLLASDKPVFADFWAVWCGPCKMTAPVFEEVADTLGDKIIFAKVNVDEQEALAVRYSVMSIPTLLFFKDGKPVDKIIGYRNKEQMLSFLQNLI